MANRMKIVVLLILLASSISVAQVIKGAELTIRDAVFTSGLTNDQKPIDVVEAFRPGETIYLSLKLHSSETFGTMKAEYFMGSRYITEVSIDLSQYSHENAHDDASMYVGLNLKQSKPFPPRNNYRIDISYKGSYIGSYFYTILPPDDAIPTRLKMATLAKAADQEFIPVLPGTFFNSENRVHLVGVADTGVGSDMQVRWYVLGTLVEEAITTMTIQENRKDNRFDFSYQPQGGWPAGEHQVELYLDGQLSQKFDFLTN